MADQTAVHEIHEFTTSGGARIFQIPLQAFPGLEGWVYAVLAEAQGVQYRVLIDSGSGLGDSNRQLEEGLAAAGRLAGVDLAPGNLTHVLLTHAHIDHFGGLAHFRPRTTALIGVHELDLRVLTHYEERLAVVTRRLAGFLIEAGVAPERRDAILDLYRMNKALFHSIPVDFTYEAAGMRLGPFEFLHTPGHCAGHVVIRLDDVLFCGDLVLAHTSPHQSPERLTLSTGLDHYLRSLEALRPWAAAARLGLGGHEEPMTNLPERIDAIYAHHQQRLAKVLDFLVEPHTIVEVSKALFGRRQGYTILLALEEAAAHVEYLYQRGQIHVTNFDDLESSEAPVPLLYSVQ